MLKADLYNRLVDMQILPLDSGVKEGAVASVVADVEATSDMSPLVAHYDPLLAIRLKELELQIKRQEHENQLLHLQEIELEFARLRGHDRPSSSTSAQPIVDVTSTLSGVSTPVHVISTPSVFDASKHVKLLPPFREAEVDTYFTAFERVAAIMRWPKDRWALLLRCRLVGKAQEVQVHLNKLECRGKLHLFQ